MHQRNAACVFLSYFVPVKLLCNTMCYDVSAGWMYPEMDSAVDYINQHDIGRMMATMFTKVTKVLSSTCTSQLMRKASWNWQYMNWNPLIGKGCRQVEVSQGRDARICFLSHNALRL